ncbi:hypothetical protein NBRC116494_22960 [Aurantivibrio plasticivorans]
MPIALRDFILIFVLIYCGSAFSDGVTIDRIYDPYVEFHEREIEWRSTFFHFDESDNVSLHKLGFGYGWTDNFFSEIYVIGERESNTQLEAVEIEAKWQLTEQGEYAADWGLLVELEKEHDDSIYESSIALLLAKDIQRWTILGNLGVGYEFDDDIENEWESSFNGQVRYRFYPHLEPGIEWYLSEDTQGLGPVAGGTIKLKGRSQVHWENGLIVGLNDTTPDYTIKLLVEYEF